MDIVGTSEVGDLRFEARRDEHGCFYIRKFYKEGTFPGSCTPNSGDHVERAIAEAKAAYYKALPPKSSTLVGGNAFVMSALADAAQEVAFQAGRAT